MKTTLITVRLRMLTPGGVTSGELRSNTMTLRTDPAGNPHLPGTSVAGSLRSHCTRDERLVASFGSEPPHEANEPSAGTRTASKLQVLGTVHRAGDDIRTRTRTAVDPWRGAADAHTLHAVEQLPPGTEFDIMLRWDDPNTGEIDAFFDALGNWQPRIGRGVSHGSGHCRVTAWGSADYDLTTEQGLLAWIQDPGLDSYPTPVERTEAPEPPQYALNLEYRIVDGIHIGTGERAENEHGVEIACVLREKHGDDEHFVIPGSSLKGVLRARAEYICRVVGTQPCTTRDCGKCRPCGLFGHTSRKSSSRAAIAIPDTIISEARCEKRQHVALDRFTGGAAPGLLYTDEVIVSGRFTLRAELIGDLDPAEQALLEAVATDLHDGLVGIGARTTSGQGTVRLTEENAHRPELTDLAALLREETPA